MDKLTIKRIQLLHPKIRQEAQEIYEKISKQLTGPAICRFSSTLRSFKEQSQLYAKGRTSPGKRVTNADAGESYHNYGLAVDIVLLVDRDGNGTYETASWDRLADWDMDKTLDWMECVQIFKSYKWEWGGDFKRFKDYPHFQKTLGYSIAELQKQPKILGTDYPRF